MRNKFHKIYVLAIIALIFGACNPVKHIPEDAVYLRKNKIDIPRAIVEPDVLYPYIRQKANKKAIWVVKVKMQQYLSFNDEKLAVKNEKKRIKLAQKNQKRLAAGKDSVEFKPVWGYRMKEKGEAPVIFDKRSISQTKTQFEKAIFNMGYFHAEVYSKLKYNSDSNKVTVIYGAEPGPQFTIKEIAIVIDDKELLPAVKKAKKFSLLHIGDPYSTEQIDKERLRFTAEMRNQGYFYFNKEYIEYEVDSTINGDYVNIKTVIKNPAEKDYVKNETTYLPHLKYTIGNITLNTSFNSNVPDQPTDSIHFENLIFINLSKLKYNPHSFVNKLFFKPGDTYSQQKEERTYSRLAGLNNFSYINIGFQPDEIDSTTLNCNILMSPLPSQTIGLETEGTHSDGNLGVSGYLTYSHRNLFGNAEELRMRIKGGVELQQIAGDTTSSILKPNTIEYGFETSLIFQDLFLPRGLSHKILQKFNRPKTSVNFIYNYQKRPDFARTLLNTSIAYGFTNKKDKISNEYLIFPLDVSFINMGEDSILQERLNDLNNPLLKSTYSDQFILGSKGIHTWTNRESFEQKSYVLNRSQIELAGNLLYAIKELLGSPKNDSGKYEVIDKIPFAQFVKVQNDWRINRKINRNQSMAYRVMGGIGFAYGNSDVLPYERSFYGGGANDNRGWKARTLGPGSYSDEDKAGIDQVGDIKIQLSAEYRFSFVKSIEGAIFADVGNIWLRQKDENRPGADWDIERSLTEFAIGMGPGARINFGFLLVRLDWGFKIYNPGKPVGSRWLFEDDYDLGPGLSNTVFNLGIGYPF